MRTASGPPTPRARSPSSIQLVRGVRVGAAIESIYTVPYRYATVLMRMLPDTAHTSRPWRIHELTGDFRVEDVWALPTPGGPDEFADLLNVVTAWDPAGSASAPVRALFALRWKLGELFGWDRADDRTDTARPTLRERLPPDLRDAPSDPQPAALPFTALYRLHNEAAGEIANRTMHGVMHLGWVADGAGDYRGQMAVLVKPNGNRG